MMRRFLQVWRGRAPMVALGVVLGLCSSLAIAAEQTPGAKDKSERVLRVGISPDYPPLAFKRDGKVVGIEPDFAARLATELKVRVEFIESGWDDLIPNLLGGRSDVIMSGMSITAERSRQMSFTEPYLRVGQMAVIRKADLDRFRDSEAMREPSTRVGFQSNTTGEDYARKSLALANLKGYGSAEEGVAALRAGEIDFFVHDAPTIWRLAGHFDARNDDLAGRFKPLTNEYLAWAVRKDETALHDELNAVLSRWEEQDEIEPILDRWIRVRKVTVEIAPSP